jgi:excisionase family DNA binding protein
MSVLAFGSSAPAQVRSWLDNTTQELFTPEQVAEAEGVSDRTIRRLLSDPRKPFGDGPYRVGRSYRIPRDSVAYFHRWARIHGVRP